MPANIGNALSAYSKTASRGTTNGLEARDVKDPGKDFATFVKEAASTAVAASERSEAMSMQGLVGKADLTEVVVAVTNAEVTLQTVVAIRNRVIQAYQEIIRMPL
jgi:flagellar hook-basal body complex protein FliE